MELAVVAGNFNGDGNPDLAVTNVGDNTVSILLGNGDGTFQAHTDFDGGLGPFSPVTGDFNGDGKLDLAVVGGYQLGTVSVLLGNGDGGWLCDGSISLFHGRCRPQW